MRAKHIDPPKSLRTNLPESLRLRLDEYLAGDSGGKVPYAAYTKYLTDVITKDLDTQAVNLFQWLGGQNPQLIRAKPETIQLLIKALGPARKELQLSLGLVQK